MIVRLTGILTCALGVTMAPAQEPDSHGPARAFARLADGQTLERIAFGSCHDQNIPKLRIPLLGDSHDIWDAIRETKPHVMVMLGDNIYAKTTDMKVMKAEYDRLDADQGFRKLRAGVPILATWDDNDYGYSDVGAEYPKKSQSQALFLEFFGAARDSPRWSREGIYDAAVYGRLGARVQIILLDTRYFRDRLEKKDPNDPPPPPDRAGPYVPTRDTSTTILGPKQWTWLEEQLRVPAELRIIASSIQVIAEDHGYEKWANFPHERQRLLRIIGETGAKGVLFISGDRHHAELSRIDEGPAYSLWELTSSSLNKPRLFTIEVNRHRVGHMYFQSNFGLITVDWQALCVLLEIRGANGNPVLAQEIPFAELGLGQ